MIGGIRPQPQSESVVHPPPEGRNDPYPPISAPLLLLSSSGRREGFESPLLLNLRTAVPGSWIPRVAERGAEPSEVARRNQSGKRDDGRLQPIEARSGERARSPATKLRSASLAGRITIGSASLIAGGDESGLVGEDHGLDAVAQAELAEQVGNV
jgi:hypothetical protein